LQVSLELGGKSALIVCKDADLDEAATSAHVGLFLNMGQCCVASSRIFVHEDIAEDFTAKVPRARAFVTPPARPPTAQLRSFS
jgi:acyl-CoA reductase-like NAD-dependent aldehyde dehydrogenase